MSDTDTFLPAYRITQRTRRQSWWTGSSELKPLGLHQTHTFVSTYTAYANQCTYMVARDLVSVELCSKFREQIKNKQTCQDLLMTRLYFLARVHLALFNAITPEATCLNSSGASPSSCAVPCGPS